MTPPFPAHFATLALPGYVNPLSARRRPGFEGQLWGTETLAGDWNGRLLIVLKDFAPSRYLRGNGYWHGADLPTNRNLVALLAQAGVHLPLDGSRARTCGILYVSASFLCADSDRMTTGISADALAASWPVLEHTLSAMPRLTDIALCGVEAWLTFAVNGRMCPIASDTRLKADRQAAQNSGAVLSFRGKRVHVTTHPQPQALNQRPAAATADWRRIIAAAGLA